MSQDAIDKRLEYRRSMAPTIDPAKACLLIIDMQEYQIRRDWALFKASNMVTPGLLDYFVGEVSDRVEPNIKRLLDVCRQQGLQVAYTMFSSFQKDGGDLTRQMKQINSRGEQMLGAPLFPHKDDPASEIVKSLEPRPEDLVVVKNTSGVFTATNFDALLKNMGIEQLLVCGVVTNMCVEGSARFGAELGYDVFIIGDACAAWSEEVHDASLRSFEMIFGHIITTDGTIAAVQESH